MQKYPLKYHSNNNVNDILHKGMKDKRNLLKKVMRDTMQMLTIHCQAVYVRSPTNPYYAYHLEITSEYYKQKWIVCKRYSEFYRLRKLIFERLKLHKKNKNCSHCSRLLSHLKTFDFPKRLNLFTDNNNKEIIKNRISGLEDFTIGLCQYISSEENHRACIEIGHLQLNIKEYLQFPLEHEKQHIRAIQNLKYITDNQVPIGTDSCPICLSGWGERQSISFTYGENLVLSNCGHYFHEHCINEWFRTRFDCPMCRKEAGLRV